MKILLLSTLLFSAIIAAQSAAPVEANQFQVCLNDISTAVEKLKEAYQTGRAKNFLDMAKYFMEGGANGIQSYESCHAVQTPDWLGWLDLHVSETVRHCAQDGLVALGELAFSVSDISKHAPQEKILQDFLILIRKLEDVLTVCFPNGHSYNFLDKLSGF